MQVIKPGRKQKGWAREFECTGKGNGGGGCGAMLLVEQDDVYCTHHYDYSGGHDVFCTFRCQECGVETDIPKEVRLPFTPRHHETIDDSPSKNDI